MHPKVATKAMTPLTKALKPQTKDLRPSTKAGGKPFKWAVLIELTDAAAQAAPLVDKLAEMERPEIRHELASGYLVTRRNPSMLTDDDLDAYIRELDRARDKCRFAVSVRRNRATARAIEAANYSRACDAIIEHREYVQGLLEENAEAARETQAVYQKDLDALVAQLDEARDEQARRTPKAAADLARELESLRSTLGTVKD